MTCRNNIRPGCKYIQAGAKVGKRRTFIGRCGGADRDGQRLTGWRHLTCIEVGVASGNHERHSVCHTARNRQIKSCRTGPTQAHVGHGGCTSLMVGDNPVDARDDVRSAGRTTAVQNPNRHDECRRCNAIIGASNRSSHMGAVTVTVLRSVSITDGREPCGNAPHQFAMG